MKSVVSDDFDLCLCCLKPVENCDCAVRESEPAQLGSPAGRPELVYGDQDVDSDEIRKIADR